MDLTVILVWIVVGGVAGLLASRLVQGTGLGLVGDIVVGIVGAFLGGFILSLFGQAGVTGVNLYSLVVAFVGAVVLLVIVRLLSGGRRRSLIGRLLSGSRRRMN
jgi:uncharacterized membrane protein YeaQ/YmgE (transglycosylase-associated protein family)